jgi:hypothetical protein
MVQRGEKEKDSRYIPEASAPAAAPCIRPVTCLRHMYTSNIGVAILLEGGLDKSLESRYTASQLLTVVTTTLIIIPVALLEAAATEIIPRVSLHLSYKFYLLINQEILSRSCNSILGFTETYG